MTGWAAFAAATGPLSVALCREAAVRSALVMSSAKILRLTDCALHPVGGGGRSPPASSPLSASSSPFGEGGGRGGGGGGGGASGGASGGGDGAAATAGTFLPGSPIANSALGLGSPPLPGATPGTPSSPYNPASPLSGQGGGAGTGGAGAGGAGANGVGSPGSANGGGGGGGMPPPPLSLDVFDQGDRVMARWREGAQRDENGDRDPVLKKIPSQAASRFVFRGPWTPATF